MDKGSGLGAGQQLNRGDYLSSTSGSCQLILQGDDGNLVFYLTTGSEKAAIWASYTQGKNSQYAIMQTDGNFVIYDTNNNALWATHTQGSSECVLSVQDDPDEPSGVVCQIVDELNGNAIWSAAAN